MLRAEVVLPPFDEKWGMRGSNSQRLGVRSRKQLSLAPYRGAKDSIHNRSLSLGNEPDAFVDRRVRSCVEEEKLVQPEPQNIAQIEINLRTAQATDPKIQQS
jgi:hypothetical protein